MPSSLRDAAVDGRARAAAVPIARLASGARRRIETAPAEAGRVHSVFARSFNLDWHDGMLLTVHGAGPLGAPFAAALAGMPDLSVVPAGAAVTRDGPRLRIGRLEIDASTGASVDLSMPAARSSPGSIAPWLTGPGAIDGAPALRSGAGLRARAGLADAVQRDDLQAFVEAAGGLIGLGEGLTPAGDDCLVGTLAALHRFAPRAAVLASRARGELRRRAEAGTTAVARDFIVHALDGAFAEAVLSVFTATGPDAARRAVAALSGMGATSGVDTLAGIHLGCLALEARSR